MKEVLKNLRSKNFFRILLLGFLGVLLIFLSVPGIFSDSGGKETSFSGEKKAEEKTRSMEEEFEAGLEKLEGVKQVDVLVRWSTDTGSFGEVKEKQASGMLIFYEGEDDAVIKEEIISAAEVLFNLPVHKIKIMKKRAEGGAE